MMNLNKRPTFAEKMAKLIAENENVNCTQVRCDTREAFDVLTISLIQEGFDVTTEVVGDDYFVTAETYDEAEVNILLSLIESLQSTLKDYDYESEPHTVFEIEKKLMELRKRNIYFYVKNDIALIDAPQQHERNTVSDLTVWISLNAETIKHFLRSRSNEYLSDIDEADPIVIAYKELTDRVRKMLKNKDTQT